jgi:hypothetical protein
MLLLLTSFPISVDAKSTHICSAYNISSIKACSDHSSIRTDHSVVVGDVSNSSISESMSLLIQLIPTVADSIPAFTKLPMSYITLALFVFVFFVLKSILLSYIVNLEHYEQISVRP